MAAANILMSPITYYGGKKSLIDELLQLLPEIKGKWLLSNYPSAVLQKYIKKNDWNSKIIAKRNQCKVSSSVEVLVWNYDQPQMSLNDLLAGGG